MNNYELANVIDDIRHDALKLMTSRNIDYDVAFELCRENLIKDNKITEFVPQKFDVEITDIKPSKINKDSSNKSLEEIIYNSLKNDIDINNYTSAQLEEYYIAQKMGVDIKIFARKEWNPMQIKFLSIMIASELDITEYINDINFDAEKAFEDKYIENKDN